jgi:beta-lactam-binding protein with PASTA domain
MTIVAVLLATVAWTAEGQPPVKSAPVKAPVPAEAKEPKAPPPPVIYVYVPNVVGLTHAAAHARLSAAGLRLTHTGIIRADLLVRSQSPLPGTRVVRGSAVHVTFIDLVMVPNIVGLTPGAARVRLNNFGLQLTYTGTPSMDAVVTNQYPGAGALVARGSAVSVAYTVSRLIVPVVVGLRADEAARQLQAVGLVFVPSGMDLGRLNEYRVTGQNPPGGVMVLRGASVVCTGEWAWAVTVPNLVGLTHSAAHLQASAASLILSHLGEPADDVVVLSQDPPAGARVAAGSVVTIQFVTLIEIPDIRGQTAEEAGVRLRLINLAMRVNDPRPGPDAMIRVFEQFPEPGSFVPPGTMVAVTCARNVAVYRYKGNVVRAGLRQIELPAELNIVVSGTKLVGRLYAPPFCQPGRQQYGARAEIVARVTGRWEDPVTIITGNYTGHLLGCEAKESADGQFTLRLEMNRIVSLQTTKLHHNHYHFDALGIVHDSMAPAAAMLKNLVLVSNGGQRDGLLPKDPNAVVVTFDYRGGLTPPRLVDVPYLRIFADGRVAIAEPFTRKPIRWERLSSAELEELVRFAVSEKQFFTLSSAGLAKSIKEAQSRGAPRVMDAATTVIRIKTAEREHEVRCNGVSIYAKELPQLKELQQLEAIEARLRTWLRE